MALLFYNLSFKRRNITMIEFVLGANLLGAFVVFIMATVNEKVTSPREEFAKRRVDFIAKKVSDIRLK